MSTFEALETSNVKVLEVDAPNTGRCCVNKTKRQQRTSLLTDNILGVLELFCVVFSLFVNGFIGVLQINENTDRSI